MRILITGANGQLGSEMRRMAEGKLQHQVFFTDVAELDICDQEAVNSFVKEKQIEVIVNCAAYTAVDKAEENPEICEKLNHIAPCYLAEAAEAQGAALIQISTDYVFDGTASKPYTEEQPTCPISVYGKTKADCERDILRICHKTMIIRTSWMYSIFGNNFMKTMIRLGKERDQLGVVADQVGTPTLAGDLAAVIYEIIDQGIKPGIFNFSNEGVCSWYEFTLAIHRLAGITTCSVRPFRTDEYPTKAKRPQYSVLDKTKIKQAYGIKIPGWEESLAKCIQEFLKIE